MICDVVTPDGQPYEGDPRYVLRRALERMAGAGLRHVQRRPRARVLPLQGRPRHRDARRGRLLRDDDDGRRERAAPGDDPRARDGRHPDRVRPPRGRAVAARDRHALRAGADDGRPHAHVPADRQGDREEGRLPRDVHAEADLRRERLGDAHAPVALHRRAATRSSTATTSGTSPRSARRSSPASSATRARSPRSSRSGSTRTSGSCPATRRRSTSPGRSGTARR